MDYENIILPAPKLAMLAWLKHLSDEALSDALSEALEKAPMEREFAASCLHIYKQRHMTPRR